jgi:hypothetical protein
MSGMAVVSWQGHTDSFNDITIRTLHMATLHSRSVVQRSCRYVDLDGQNELEVVRLKNR